MNRTPLMCLGLYALASATASAQAPKPSDAAITYSPIHYTPVTTDELATYWQLQPIEITTYQRYMALEGHYHYAHLDPVMVLGLISTDIDDRRRYAERYVQAERQRIQQQTTFAQLIAAAQLNLYGPEPLFDFSKLPQAPSSPGYLKARTAGLGKGQGDANDLTPRPGDVIELLIGADCTTPCQTLLNQALETPDVTIHLYGRGFTDANALAQWLITAAEHHPMFPAALERIQLKGDDPLLFPADTEWPRAQLRRNGLVIGTLE